MKKVKIFKSMMGTGLISVQSIEAMEKEANDFLAREDIKIFDVMFQASSAVFAILVYYDEPLKG